MRASTYPVEYFIQPPDIPEYLYRHNVDAWYKLMYWSWKEYNTRLKESAKRGDFRGVTQYSKQSPYLILARLHGFRKMCSIITPSTWKKLKKREQEFIIKAYKLRDMVFREQVL